MNIIQHCIYLTVSAATLCLGSLASAQYTLSTLVTFNGTNGNGPLAGLIADASGNLYSTTETGGANGYGTVFEVAAGTHTLSSMATFNYTNGAYPYAGLIADGSGNLYGTTYSGGANSDGTLFEVANNANHTVSNLVMFDGTNGAGPSSNLIADANGNLYGTTSGFGNNSLMNGTVFEVANNANHTLSTLATFNGTNGANPYAGLITDSSGNLYGTTTGGGANGNGTVFEVANNANHTLSTLVTFNGTNGAVPSGNLIADTSGNLYGTTSGGGANGDGTVFEVANNANHTLSTLATFNGTNGSVPDLATLIADGNGNLYGTTYKGGANGDGLVFEVANNANHTLSTLVTFDGTNGQNPIGGLIADAGGNLYGTTFLGGANNGGTIFELSPDRPGDFNLDGHVDARDVSAMVAALANLSGYQTAHNNLTNAQLKYIEDVNGDGVVNNADLQALLNMLQSGGGSVDPVPEPSGLLLLALGGFALAVRRRIEKQARQLKKSSQRFREAHLPTTQNTLVC